MMRATGHLAIDERSRFGSEECMSSVSTAACISVLMPAYNAERYILPSILSVLAQTFEDFELVVVDDCSTDRTADILSSIRDKRLRVLRNQANLGIVGSLNRAMAEARGRYIARIDADDYCLPTRFAKQKRYLDQHPDVLLIGAETFILEGKHVRHDRRRADPDPAVLRWQCLVSNPVGHPTMMFRADAVAALGTYLREEFRYAEDFDFSHRLLHLGDLAVLPESLIIYRLHEQNLTRTGRAEMIAKTAAVLARVYSELLGEDCASEAAMVAEHVMGSEPVRSLAALEQIGALLNRLITAFLAANELDEERAARVIAHAGDVWWATVQASLRAGVVVPAALGHDRFRWSRGRRPPLYRIARSAASGLIRGKLPALRRLTATGDAFGMGKTRIEDDGLRGEDPPRLYAVVDLGSEASAETGSRAAQDGAQRIFDRFGLRPIYLLDGTAAPVGGYERLRRLLERHACAVGLRLPDEPDEQALRTLVSMIQETLGVVFPFVEAGPSDAGRRALATLANLGTAVDLCTLTDAVTLTPESVTAEEQIRLACTMAGRGRRTFTLRYGGLSSIDEEAFVQRIDAVCRFFFQEIGAMPGNPADLVPLQMRERVWPHREWAETIARPGAIAVSNDE